MYLRTPSIHGLPSILNIHEVSSFSPSPSHPRYRIPPYIPKLPMLIARLVLWI